MCFMTMGSLNEDVEARLRLADEMLNDAKSFLRDGHLKSAADRAYYSMFHAAQAALANEGMKPPRTHSGLRSQFARHFVRAGIVEREFSKHLTLAQEMREKSTYEVYADISRGSTEELVDNAEAFVQRIKALVGEERL